MTDRTPLSLPSPAASYRRLGRRRAAILAVVILLVVASLALDVFSGPARLTFSDVAATLLHRGGDGGVNQTIVWTFRLPTALMALIVGASLGAAGAEMQTVLNNPLASPFTLGVSAAASFGAALAMMFGSLPWLPAPAYFVPVSAFAWAMLCSMSVYGIGRARSGTTESLIAGGVALHFVFSSGVAFLQYIASDDALQAIVFWIFGTLEGATWQKLAIVTGVLSASVLFLSSQAWQLTALRLGENHARGLGVNVPRVRLQTLVIISVLTATAVCFTGAIGFIGLVAPHLSRMAVGEDQRFFLPLSALLGALLVSVAANISEALVPGTILPIGITTAAIGAPFFACVALFRRRASW